jgi:hypothetical protein
MMPDRETDTESSPAPNAREASSESGRGVDSGGMRDSEAGGTGPWETPPGSQATGRAVWRRQSAGPVDQGVCASWCAMVSRGPSASISRFSLRMSGVTTWVFMQPRRVGGGRGVGRANSCSTSLRQSRG